MTGTVEESRIDHFSMKKLEKMFIFQLLVRSDPGEENFSSRMKTLWQRLHQNPNVDCNLTYKMA